MENIKNEDQLNTYIQKEFQQILMPFMYMK